MNIKADKKVNGKKVNGEKANDTTQRSINLDRLKQPVVVTGALGFIGRRVIDIMLENKVSNIVAFDLPGSVKPANWNDVVTLVEGDISRPADVNKVMENAATIIHLAAMVGDWIPLAQHKKVTIEGSRNVFEAALRNNTRVVLASSIAVYANKLPKGQCSEETVWGDSVGAYSYCKQEQEKLAWRYHNDKGMQLSVVRPANVYGPGSKPWLYDVIDVLKTGQPALVNKGNHRAGLVYVDNVVQLLLLAASRDEALGQVYNGADGSLTTWRDYFVDLAKIVGAPTPKSMPYFVVKYASTVVETIWKKLSLKGRPPITKEALNLVAAETCIPIEKAQRELNYQPWVSYAQGIAAIEQFLEDGKKTIHE